MNHVHKIYDETYHLLEEEKLLLPTSKLFPSTHKGMSLDVGSMYETHTPCEGGRSSPDKYQNFSKIKSITLMYSMNVI